MKKVFLFLCLFSVSLSAFDYTDDNTTEEKKEEQVAPERIAQLQKVAQQLPDIIAQIQQKAAGDRQLETMLLPWQATLDQINQISFILQNEMYAKLASTKQFEKFYNAFTVLKKDLDNLNKLLFVPEFSLQAQNIYELLGLTSGASDQEVKKAYNQAVKQKLQQINTLQDENEIAALRQEVGALMQMYGVFVAEGQEERVVQEVINLLKEFKAQNVMADFEKLEKAYGQVAAKIKKEQEAQEAKALREQQPSIDYDFDDYEPDYDFYDDDWYV